MWFLVGTSVLFSGLALFAHHETNLQGFAYLGGVIMAYMLLYWLEYDVIRNPFISLFGQNDHRKRRNLMLALGDVTDGSLA